MDRTSKLGIVAAALMAAPIPALAQTWPALAVTTVGHGVVGQTAPPLGVPADNPASVNAPALQTPPPLILAWAPPRTTAEAQAALPEVRIPAKPEWTDDQGLRLHYAEVVYKQRF